MAIILEKQGDKHTFNLDKTGELRGEILINLAWNQGGFLSRIFGKAQDLDLGCFYELQNGWKSVIDGLQFSHGRGGSRTQISCQGSYTHAPYIWHTGDDRGSSSSSGESILVNPEGIKQIKRIIVYTFIYEGAANWSETNAVVRVVIPGLEEVHVEMGKQSSKQGFCAIAEINLTPNGQMTIQKLVTFHNGHEDCDRHYGWGFNYSPGRK